jgi:hypothetical protein
MPAGAGRHSWTGASRASATRSTGNKAQRARPAAGRPATTVDPAWFTYWANRTSRRPAQEVPRTAPVTGSTRRLGRQQTYRRQVRRGRDTQLGSANGGLTSLAGPDRSTRAAFLLSTLRSAAGCRSVPPNRVPTAAGSYAAQRRAACRPAPGGPRHGLRRRAPLVATRASAAIEAAVSTFRSGSRVGPGPDSGREVAAACPWPARA